MADGHDVVLATEERVRPIIEEFGEYNSLHPCLAHKSDHLVHVSLGVPFFRIPGDPTRRLETPEAQQMLRNNEVHYANTNKIDL
jgi:hypothetical protein